MSFRWRVRDENGERSCLAAKSGSSWSGLALLSAHQPWAGDGHMRQHIALATTRPDAGGVLTTAVGLACSVVGISLVLNLRGWADRWYETEARRRVPRWLNRIPPWKWSDAGDLKVMMRIYAWCFAIIGPPVFVLGIVRISTGHL